MEQMIAAADHVCNATQHLLVPETRLRTAGQASIMAVWDS
jgi:hypothetical protein